MLQMVTSLRGYYPAPELGATNPYKVNWAYTKPGFQRGNPDNNDSYFFVVMSMYKKLDSKTKAYRTINMHKKRKLKLRFNEYKNLYIYYIIFYSY
ncbi:MAG: hypothetical protein CM15mP65_20470 [Crocinitomicaceae bacterium]|nr:MAG: hypothetical protein CM15mP65_20470 [Crocinitomicaceae bacterium]